MASFDWESWFWTSTCGKQWSSSCICGCAIRHWPSYVDFSGLPDLTRESTVSQLQPGLRQMQSSGRDKNKGLDSDDGPKNRIRIFRLDTENAIWRSVLYIDRRRRYTWFLF
jgi:hypothetical protein